MHQILLYINHSLFKIFDSKNCGHRIHVLFMMHDVYWYCQMKKKRMIMNILKKEWFIWKFGGKGEYCYVLLINLYYIHDPPFFFWHAILETALTHMRSEKVRTILTIVMDFVSSSPFSLLPPFFQNFYINHSLFKIFDSKNCGHRIHVLFMMHDVYWYCQMKKKRMIMCDYWCITNV
jgi:hypothetical protein